MSLSRIGPVVMDHRTPQLRWTSSPDNHGIRGCSISGQTTHAGARQLSELVANPHRNVTISGHSGVLEFIDLTGSESTDMDANYVRPFRGFYLLQGFDVSAERPWSTTPYMPFSLTAVYLGDHRTVVVAPTGHARVNDYSLAARVFVANPFWSEDSGGGQFAADPGGTRFARDYHETFPHSTSILTEPAT